MDLQSLQRKVAGTGGVCRMVGDRRHSGCLRLADALAPGEAVELRGGAGQQQGCAGGADRAAARTCIVLGGRGATWSMITSNLGLLVGKSKETSAKLIPDTATQWGVLAV